MGGLFNFKPGIAHSLKEQIMNALLSPLGYDLRENIQYDALLDFDENGPGLTLANQDGIFFVILRDASTPGHWRYQAFDKDGMLEHCTQLTPKAAIAAAIEGRGACLIVSRNTLDTVAAVWLERDAERRRSQ
jgi:hypothetical protein